MNTKKPITSKTCARINICRSATKKGKHCVHYNDTEGYPCEHECAYWDEIKDWFGGIDEIHRFPIYKPGDVLYSLELNMLDSVIKLNRFNFDKVKIIKKAKSGRDGWYYECEDDTFFAQIFLFKTKEDCVQFMIKYFKRKEKYYTDIIKKVSELV